MYRKLTRKWLKVSGLYVFLLVAGISCAPQSNAINPLDSSGDELFEPIPSNPVETGRVLSTCLDLNFSGLVAPNTTPRVLDWQAFQLALNISGSFEGNDQWKNISNNFDDQGLSVGLLNQNLGSGSLQPLLNEAWFSNPSITSFFSSAHQTALRTMIDNWNRSPSTSAGVTWAKNNLYNSSGNFKDNWKQELQAAAGSAPYRQVQVKAAGKYHQYAFNFIKQFSLSELRAYLFVFDISVQNGGFYSSDVRDYQAFIRSNPSANMDSRLDKLLELRLRHVRPEYVEDVRSRKNLLIDGRGVVHKSPRAIENQYCFDRRFDYQ